LRLLKTGHRRNQRSVFGDVALQVRTAEMGERGEQAIEIF
jgi:hypothetical protein